MKYKNISIQEIVFDKNKNCIVAAEGDATNNGMKRKTFGFCGVYNVKKNRFGRTTIYPKNYSKLDIKRLVLKELNIEIDKNPALLGDIPPLH